MQTGFRTLPAGSAAGTAASRHARCARRSVLCRVASTAQQAAVVAEHAPAAPGAVGINGIMLQGFHWDSHRHHRSWYSHLSDLVESMQAAGVSHVWLPPPSQSVSPEGYLPGQLYNLNSAYGSEAELKALVAQLKAAGIAPLADIVINHRCADTQDEHGRWNNFHDDHDHHGAPIDWGRWAITGDDHEFGGQGAADTGADFWGAPDLDHTNPQLRAALCDWLSHLRTDIGFVGWRFDFAKGYAARFIKEYVEASGASNALSVGEMWVDLHWPDGCLAHDQDAARQALCDWLDGCGGAASAFDFCTKGILQAAIGSCEYWRLADSNNKPPGLVGWWPKKAVTFIDNHDTGSTQAHWPFPSSGVEQGYAYIFTHPGMPCVFYDHLFTWGDELRGHITRLAQVRREAGITAGSKVEILAAKGDMYVSRCEGKHAALILKLGPRYDMGGLLPSAERGWERVAKGKHWAVWMRPHEEGGAC